MPTVEKRLQVLEQENAARKRENAARKKAEELLTITVHALVSKEAFEQLREQHGKLFDVLNTHNISTNGRLADLQNQVTELDGKIVGQQTEMRQRFAELDGKIVGLQTETRQRFTEMDGKITGLQTTVTGLQTTVAGLQTTQAEHTTLLQQILARLPEKPQQ